MVYRNVPSLLHNYYRSITSDDMVKENREMYNEITSSISEGHGSLEKSIMSRDSLYLWFHVRGLQIDEDHFGISKHEEWKELLEYMRK